MHHVFIDVNQAIDRSLPKHKPQGETPGSEKHRSCSCRKRKQILIYLISRDGRWGRKSFPTKKHIKTQSSTLLSKSKVKGKLAMVSSLSKYCNIHKKKELREHCTGFEWYLQPAAAAAATPHLSQDTQADKDELLLRDGQGVGKLIVLKQRRCTSDPSASQSFSSPTCKACFKRSWERSKNRLPSPCAKHVFCCFAHLFSYWSFVFIQRENPQTTEHLKCGYQVWHETFVFLLPRGKPGIPNNNLHHAPAKTNSKNNLIISSYAKLRVKKILEIAKFLPFLVSLWADLGNP